LLTKCTIDKEKDTQNGALNKILSTLKCQTADSLAQQQTLSIFKKENKNSIELQ